MPFHRYFAPIAPNGHMPQYVVWAVSFCIPVLVALVNYFMVVADMKFVGWKFDSFQALIESDGLASGVLALLGMSCMFGFLAVLLVTVFAPSTAGSGIPEVLGFLNGNRLPGLFSLRSCLVRILGIVLAQAAGFPLGREGPMVSIGGGIGFGVAYLLTRPYEARSEKVIPETDLRTGEFNLATSTAIMNQERFAHTRRIGCALGGAAGIATAFNAPIGGILYMFEELSTSSLMPKFQIFMCTVISAFMTRWLLVVTSTDFHRLVIYESAADSHSGFWDWADVPVFMLIAMGIGAFAGCFARVAVIVWKQRFVMAKRLSKWQPYAKIVECTLYCALCAAIFSMIPVFLGDCEEADSPAAQAEHHRRLKASLHHVRHTCSEEEHNEVATLLLQGAEGAVKHLFSHSNTMKSVSPLIVVFVTYSTLALGMPGLGIPMGTFIPSMLIGGLLGRVMGEAIPSVFAVVGLNAAPAGVYAVVGSAAMLSGFTHMTLGIVALLVEALADLGLVIPLMVTVYIASFMSKLISPHGYDEQLIIAKGVPFLDSDLPKEFDISRFTALDICHIPSREAVLPRKASIKTIRRALRQKDVNYFPIVSDGGHCAGITTRGRLKAVLAAVMSGTGADANDATSAAAKTSVLGRRYSQGSGSGGNVDLNNEKTRPSTVSADSSECESLGTSMTSMTSISVSPFFSWLPTMLTQKSNSTPMRPTSTRKSLGNLGDHAVESKMRSMIGELFSKPQNLKNLHSNHDDDDIDGEESFLPIERIMDPAPYMVHESMPVQKFYGLFRNVDMNVICVLSRHGKFLGILTRRGLIAAANDLHDKKGQTAVQQVSNRRLRDDIEAQAPCGIVSLKMPDSGSVEFRRLDQDADVVVSRRGGWRTPSETDAGSSVYDSTSDECDTGSEDLHLDTMSGIIPVSPGRVRRHRRSHSTCTDRSIGSSSSTSTTPANTIRHSHPHSTHVSGHTENTEGSAASGAAMAVVEMLGPAELRTQLAASWSRLAASEQQQETLRQRLAEAERRLSESDRQQDAGGTSSTPNATSAAPAADTNRTSFPRSGEQKWNQKLRMQNPSSRSSSGSPPGTPGVIRSPGRFSPNDSPRRQSSKGALAPPVVQEEKRACANDNITEIVIAGLADEDPKGRLSHDSDVSIDVLDTKDPSYGSPQFISESQYAATTDVDAQIYGSSERSLGSNIVASEAGGLCPKQAS